MKKSLLAPFLGVFLFLSLFACSEETSTEDMSSELDEEVVEETNSEDTSDDQSSNDDSDSNDSNHDNSDNSDTTAATIELIASADILSNAGEGLQNWGNGVTLRALKIDGSAGQLVFDTEFRDEGFGVAGARWDQIDYYVMYQGQEVNASEKIELFFDEPATDIVITVGMMGANEGHPNGETGKWTAYDQSQNQVAQGEFGANESTLGKEVKLVNGSYGTYPIAVNAATQVYSIIIEATGFGYGEGSPKNVNSYNNESGNKENNSDFNLVGISFKNE